VEAYYKQSISITVAEDKKYRVWPAEMMKFDFLYHSTEYTAYFIADRLYAGDRKLMGDSGIIAVKIKTERELFRVEDNIQIKSFAGILLWKLVISLVVVWIRLI
jgi:hypothetical protein